MAIHSTSSRILPWTGAALLATAGLTLSPSDARGDLLFLDLNVSTSEIKAAQNAARARGEKLHVIPEIAPQVRKAITELDTEAYLIQQKINRLKRSIDATPEGAAKESLLAEHRKLSANITDFENYRGKIAAKFRRKPSAIGDEIQKLLSKGVRIDTLIVSGHSNGVDFTGHLGTLETTDVRKILQLVPQLQQDVQSVFLWGCYTGARGNMLTWKDEFPNSQLILGFHDQGPTNMTQGGPTVLESALTLEPLLKKTPAHTRDAERALRSIREAAFYPTAGLFGNIHVGIGIETTLVTAEDLSCEAEFRVLEEEYLNVYIPNFNGTTASGNVELGTQSALRKFYNRYQANLHCDKVKELDLSPAEIVALLHPKSVQANFVQKFRPSLQDLLFKLKLIPHGQLSASLLERLMNGSLTRREIIALGKDLLRHLSLQEIMDDSDISVIPTPYHAVSPLTPIEKETVLTVVSRLMQLECIPLSWVEMPSPRVEPEAPSCE